MRTSNLPHPRFLLLPLYGLLLSVSAWSQTPTAQTRILERVNDTTLTTLHGNTHPLAQARFDQGTAPPDLPMSRMLLLLKRSDAQESALQALLDAQQDPNSPSYHQWLTPDAFGQQFGPSDLDVQTIAAWLGAHGFQIGGVSRGRTVIEFSGTAAQVQQAFHTEIHKFVVNGETHWANASDPQIPAALAPVIVGVNSLHNFAKQPAHHIGGVYSKSRATGEVTSIRPGFTLQSAGSCSATGTCYFVGPYDFAKIYNVLPLWEASPAIDGTGQSIAILGRSDVALQDVRDFRNLFGLPANDPAFIVNGADPGIVPDDETEAALDVEWSGAVAKGAKINLIISGSTETTDGIDLSALYAVEHNVSPIINESFSLCELFLGTAGNSFQNAVRQQAAAQGITFVTSTGDQGAAGCDVSAGAPPEPAGHGLMVSGLASSPYGVAVGGTDFSNYGPNYTLSSLNSPSPYWSVTNDTNHASALGYIPESTWNDTCANNIFVVLNFGASVEAGCNNSQARNWVETFAASGGKSSCISSSGVAVSSCTGGYGKPSWQSAPGVPADGARDIPDVSLFAGSGIMGSAYMICEADQTQLRGSCGLTGIQYDFVAIGGTSAASPAFAGIMALVNQYAQSSGQGNANPVLYKLASSTAQRNANCNSSAIPASGCIFNDVTAGTIATPCTAQSPNCAVSVGSDTYGILSGYSAVTGYDTATGLGSVNAYNLVHNWGTPGISTATTLSLNSGNAVNITHGQPVPFSIAVNPSAATGNVSLVGSSAAGNSVDLGSFLTLQNGAVSGTTASLAGGTSYQVKAHYAGDTVYAPSDSTPVTVTVAPEPSKTLISLPVFDPITGNETADAPATLTYGTPYIARVDVGSANASLSFPMRPVCAQSACPTGSVTLNDSINGGPAAPLGSGVYPLNSEGFAEYYAIQLTGGTHQLAAGYAGDNSFNPSTGTYALTVTPGATRIISSNPPLPPFVSTPFNVSVILTMNFFGDMPSCNFTFFDGTATLPGTPTCQWQANGPFLYISLPVTQSTAGRHTYSAKFTGDANYAPSASVPLMTQVYYGTTTTLASDSTSVPYGSSITLSALVDSNQSTGPTLPNAITFYYNNSPISGTVSYTPTTDASGNFALRASISFVPQFSSFAAAMFNGDSNYAQSGSTTIDVSVSIPDFTLSGNLSSPSITAGNSATGTITVTPAGNASSPVTLACPTDEMPPGISCGFSPPTVNLSNAVASTASLTISTLPPSSSATTSSMPVFRRRLFAPRSLEAAPFFSLVALLFVFLILSRPVGNRVVPGVVRAFCLLLFLGFVGCGSGSSGGGGGGGASPTSISLTASSVKVPYSSISGGAVNLTAKISSSESAGGTVTLSVDPGNGYSVTSQVIGGVAQFQMNSLSVGIHTFTAQYAGDSKNLGSQTTGGLHIAVTGQTGITVQAKTGGLYHSLGITVVLQ